MEANRLMSLRMLGSGFESSAWKNFWQSTAIRAVFMMVICFAEGGRGQNLESDGRADNEDAFSVDDVTLTCSTKPTIRSTKAQQHRNC